jgi:hypothetical protein
VWLTSAGFAIVLGKDEETVALCRRSIETNRNYDPAHFCLAAALAHLGLLGEARAAVHAALALNPSFTITRFRTGRPSDNPTYLTQRERLLDGMRKAGVPEG